VPAPVAEGDGALGGADDVSEEHRRERPVGLAARSVPGEELLNLVDDAVDVAHKRIMLVARKLDEARAGNVLGEVAATVDRRGHVAAAVQDECRRGDRRERGAHVYPRVPPDQLSRHTRRCGEALEAREPTVEVLVLAQGRRDDRRKVTAPPGGLEVLVHEISRGLVDPIPPARGRPIDDQRLDRFRIGGGEERG
jgi:hypothetical protein